MVKGMEEEEGEGKSGEEEEEVDNEAWEEGVEDEEDEESADEEGNFEPGHMEGEVMIWLDQLVPKWTRFGGSGELHAFWEVLCNHGPSKV